MQSSLSAKIIRNVLSGGVRALLLAPVPFVMTPLILSRIGTGGYGTWAVLMSFSSLTSLADLGMVGTVSKYVAEYHARKDSQSLNRLLNTGLIIYLILSSAVAMLFWFSGPLITKALLRASPLRESELTVTLRYFSIVIGGNIVTALLSSITTGLQRLDLTNLMGTINVLGAALVGGTLLVQGWGLQGLVTAQVSSSIVTVAIYCALVKKLLPETKFGVRYVDGSEGKKMFSFSLQLYVTQAAVAVQNQLEKFLLAFFVGVTAAGWYDIASDVAVKLRGLIGLVLAPVLPAASELDALRDERRMTELYYRAHKYLAFFGLPLVCFVTVVSKRFMELWVGPSMGFIGVPLAILMWVNFYNLLTGPGFLIFAGRGYLRPNIQACCVSLGLNIVLSPVLIFLLGFTGAVFGTFASITLGTIYFFHISHRQTEYSIARLFREAYMKPLVAAGALSSPLWVVFKEYAQSWTTVVALGFAFSSLYLVAVLASRFFDPYDWSKIENLIPIARHARKLIPVE